MFLQNIIQAIQQNPDSVRVWTGIFLVALVLGLLLIIMFLQWLTKHKVYAWAFIISAAIILIIAALTTGK
jgi:hypothetical protein